MPPEAGADESVVGRAVGVGDAESGQDPVFHRQVLLGAALGQSGGTPDDARLLDHLVAGELLAGQVDLGCIWHREPRPVRYSLGIEVRGGSVTAEGELDFRGTLAIDKEVPAGFRAIRVRFDLGTDASEGDLGRLLRLTERCCVVQQTIAGTPQLRVGAASTQ
jgi:hypothetical protein